MKKNYLYLVSLVAMQSALAQGEYVTGDFHQHSTYSDGSWKIGKVMDKNAQYGLDWWSNSEHGGAFANYGRNAGWDELINGTQVRGASTWSDLSKRDGAVELKGDDAQGKMWRWQSILEYSYLDVKEARSKYPEKMIFQGFEWNAPGHEHVDVTIIAHQFDTEDNCSPVAEFEYKFDNNDADQTGGAAMGWSKSTLSGKEKTLEAISWMQQNYAGEGWIVPTHPERKQKYSIADFRNMNNAGADVCFGFDSQPGHQKGANRGGYSTSALEGTTGATWGGTGAMAARVGGMWDALLSEGRNWWLFANSDFHDINDDFFPGEYQKTYTFVEDRNNPQAIAKGLRSGNSFIVTGDLIDELDFTIEGAVMGSTLQAESNEVTVSITVHDPESANHNTYSDYTNPSLDHIDLIAGEITGIVNPTDANYDDPNAAATKVIARFDAAGNITDAANVVSTQWTDLGNGYKKVAYKITVDKDMYFRLRGTNLGLNVEGETDDCGNPMVDTAGENTAAKAFADLWFYSNPIFVKAHTTSAERINGGDQIIISSRNENVNVAFAQPTSAAVRVYNALGETAKSSRLDNVSTALIATAELAKGNYIVEVTTQDGAKKSEKIQIR